jgi:hypothetical protein
MRPAIPKPDAVGSAFRVLAKRLATVRKKVNAEAAKEMKVGDYEAAQGWMGVGRSLSDFAQRVDAFAKEWKTLVRTTRIAAQANKPLRAGNGANAKGPKRTPAWKFCEPALKALAAHGGKATTDELIADLGRDLAPSLGAPDRRVAPAKGVPQWQVALAQAYRECQREGWIEKRRDGLWKITAAGKGVAA